MENNGKMIKRFYHRNRPAKIFFDPALSLRSTAYGGEVLKEFIEWRRYFHTRWNDGTDNFLICEQGEVGGNPIRGDASFGIQKAAIPVRNSDSALPPLWIGKQFFEVDAEGGVSVNGEKRRARIGVELKAWAMTSVYLQNRWKNFLLVIGKRKGAMQLSLHPVTEDGDVQEAVSSFDLAPTLEPKSFLAAFGRHIFIVHNATLYYVYFSPLTNELEQVPVGENGDCCKYALPFVVCGEEGNVFWVADNTLYGITIGSPRNLRTLEKIENGAFVSLQCFGGALYLSKKNDCTRYVRLDSGEYCAAAFGSGAKQNLFVSSARDKIQYIKLTPVGNGLSAQSTQFSGNREQRVAVPVTLPEADTVFCFAGNLVADVRYVGTDGRNLIAIDK